MKEAHIHNSKSVSKTEYNVLHTWIKRKYGRASKCEHPDCPGESKYYDWALIKGKAYERNISNFWQLCRSCHLKYDCSEETRKKIGVRMVAYWGKEENKNRLRAFRRSFKFSNETLRKMSISRSGEKNHMFGVRLTGTNNHMTGKHHTVSAKKLISIKNSPFNAEQVNVIRAAANYGCPQIELAKTFNSSTAAISRLVNKKRYALW